MQGQTQRAKELMNRLRTGFLLCDGGYGAMLRAAGLKPGECEELLNLTAPERVAALHRAFLEAGAQIIETNTFQANRISLGRAGLADRAAEVNAAAAQIARETAATRAFVAGSIGPTGHLLEPLGELSRREAADAFSEQAAALAQSGVDFFIVETFVDLEEIRLAITAARETGLPVAASLAFDPSGRTAFGVSASQAAAALPEFGADIIGANCGTVSPQEMEGILAKMKAGTGLPLLAQPNAGRPQLVGNATVYPETPEAMGEAAARFRQLGVSLIGGCCGCRPEHIQAMAAKLEELYLVEGPGSD